MNRLAGIVLLGALAASGLAAPAHAQADPEQEVGNLYAGASEARGVVRLGLTFQRYTYEPVGGRSQALSQVSAPLFVSYPITEGLGVSLRTVYATGGGDGLESVSGLADAQLGVSYRSPVGPATAVLSLGVGLPLGGSALAPDQIATAVLFSRNEFAFEAPTLRQGFRLAPGVTVAVPVTQSFAVGFALAYQVRSSFEPFEGLDATYSPANELLLAGGFDVRMGPRAVASLDLSYGLYGTDTIGELSLDPGNRFTGALRVQTEAGSVPVHFLARYRSRGDGEAGGTLLEPSVPNEIVLGLGAAFGVGEGVTVGTSVGARYFGRFGEVRADDFGGDLRGVIEEQLLLDLGVAPAVHLSERLRLVSRFSYVLGLGGLLDTDAIASLNGFRAGAGVEVRF